MNESFVAEETAMLSRYFSWKIFFMWRNWVIQPFFGSLPYDDDRGSYCQDHLVDRI